MDTNADCAYSSRAHMPFQQQSWLRLSPQRLIARIQCWMERSAQRRQLSRLDDRMLRDIGIGRADAYRETQKWFWQD